MIAYKTNMDKNGRILIPARLREKLNLNINDRFLVIEENNKITISTLNDVIFEVQNLISEYTSPDESPVDELFKRREEEHKLEEELFNKFENNESSKNLSREKNND